MVPVSATTVIYMARIVCSLVSVVGCDLTVLQEGAQYDRHTVGESPPTVLLRLTGIIERPEGILLTMEPRRAVRFWFMLSSAWCRWSNWTV